MTFQPVLFLSHGSPMLALEGGAWGEAMARFGAAQRPEAVLMISAHWEASGVPRLTAAPRPGVIHDFGGFPDELYQLDYPAPGAPALVERMRPLLRAAGVDTLADPSRALDHGAWVPLRHMYPDADVPVVQLSLPRPRSPRELHRMGAALAPLREEGVLIVGSGGLVHNLRRLAWQGGGETEAWAADFDAWADGRARAGDAAALLDWEAQAPDPRTAHPSTEHFDPLFVALGAAGDAGAGPLFEGWQLGNLSLRSFIWS
jgi:4,5-DOPA dioxygenase extradiol